MAHYSSKLQKVSKDRIERFLVDLACTKSELSGSERKYESMRRILKVYPEFFGPLFPVKSQLSNDRERQYESLVSGTLHEPYTEQERETDSLDAFIKWANILRRAWDETDSRRREWWLFELRRDFYLNMEPQGSASAVVPPPSKTAFEQAVFYLQKRIRFAKHCDNPDCMSPYFLASSSRGKRCSDACREWAQDQFNLEYYHNTGKAKRAAKGRKRGKK
jgi:hypothetical protein